MMERAVGQYVEEVQEFVREYGKSSLAITRRYDWDSKEVRHVVEVRTDAWHTDTHMANPMISREESYPEASHTLAQLKTELEADELLYELEMGLYSGNKYFDSITVIDASKGEMNRLELERYKESGMYMIGEGAVLLDRGLLKPNSHFERGGSVKGIIDFINGNDDYCFYKEEHTDFRLFRLRTEDDMRYVVTFTEK